MKLIKPFVFFSALFISSVLLAQLKLPALFSDNMVIQQKADVKFWGWATAGQSISVQTSWNNEKYQTKTNKEGRWDLDIPTPVAGGPYEIAISGEKTLLLKNILVGEVWLCAGQSNMEMPMKGFKGQPVLGSNEDVLKSKNNNIRFISIPRSKKTLPQDDFEGEWKAAEPQTVYCFSATAYYFGRLIEEILDDVPIGLVEVSYGGSCVEAWTSRENALEFNGQKVPDIKDSLKIDNRTPTSLFNGMLHPVIGYTIKGAIWYQGETNYINSKNYTDRFSTMVKEWRNLWGQGDFPFYYTQIAPFDYAVFHKNEKFKEVYSSAYLREAQLKALKVIPNSNMAVLMDIANKTNIHPPNKKVGGERLAYIALSEQYGIKGIGYMPPVMHGIEIKDSLLIVSFDNIPMGITSFGKEVSCFEIAGEDHIFYPAKAKVRSKSVVLSSSDVEKPVAVRYAFKDFVVGQLFSTEGIPVPSFRSDNW